MLKGHCASGVYFAVSETRRSTAISHVADCKTCFYYFPAWLLSIYIDISALRSLRKEGRWQRRTERRLRLSLSLSLLASLSDKIGWERAPLCWQSYRRHGSFSTQWRSCIGRPGKQINNVGERKIGLAKVSGHRNGLKVHCSLIIARDIFQVNCRIH